MSGTITVRVDDDIKEHLEKLSKSTARTKSFLIVEAIKNFLKLNEWQIEAINKGIESADKGRLVNHEDVVEWVESWGTQKELKRPECD